MIDDAPMTTRGDSYTGPGGDGHGPALSVQNPVTMTTRPQVVSRDASGRSLSPSVAAKFEYLTTIDSRVMSKRDRSTKRVYEAVHDLALRLRLPEEVEDRAFLVARKTVEARILKGWEFPLLVGGAVFFALVERDGYAVLADLAPAIRATHPDEVESNLWTALKRMQVVMGIRLKRVTSLDIAQDIAQRLGLPAAALPLVKNSLAHMRATGNPKIDASAAVYEASVEVGAGLSQRRIADACDTTDVSMRKRLDAEPSNSPAVIEEATR